MPLHVLIVLTSPPLPRPPPPPHTTVGLLGAGQLGTARRARHERCQLAADRFLGAAWCPLPFPRQQQGATRCPLLLLLLLLRFVLPRLLPCLLPLPGTCRCCCQHHQQGKHEKHQHQHPGTSKPRHPPPCCWPLWLRPPHSPFLPFPRGKQRRRRQLPQPNPPQWRLQSWPCLPSSSSLPTHNARHGRRSPPSPPTSPRHPCSCCSCCCCSYTSTHLLLFLLLLLLLLVGDGE